MTTWIDTLKKSAALHNKSLGDRKKSSALLWDGAKEGIGEWLQFTDVSAEALRTDLLDALGDSRKGDVSKIVTVALAAKDNRLLLEQYANLSQAYAEATRLTKTVKVHAAEDTAADEAVQAIEAPKSTTKPEGAALLVMAQGVDDAARLLLDALGADNTAAHRAFLRAVSQEIAGRNKPAPKPKKVATPKAAKPKKAAVAKSGAAKPKATAVKPVTRAKPVKRAAAKAAPVEVEPTLDDMYDEIEVDGTDSVEVAPVRKAQPVKRAAVKRPARAS